MSRKELSRTPLHTALRYLSSRSRTESEVRQKLVTSGFPEEHIHTTLETLRSRNYVNDEDLARDWTRDRTAQLGYGPLLVERELSRRGVDAQVIHRVISEIFGHGEEFERAKAVIERRFGHDDLYIPKSLKRAEALLVRRGYHRSVIYAVLGPYFEQI